MTIHQNFIAGEWVKADRGAPNINPSDLKDVVGFGDAGGRDDAAKRIGIVDEVLAQCLTRPAKCPASATTKAVQPARASAVKMGAKPTADTSGASGV